MTVDVEPNRDNWETPWPVIYAVSDWMGAPPSVDLCASHANKKANAYFTQAQDLLSRDPRAQASWRDNWAWMNPPYSRALILQFCSWAARCAAAGNTIAILVNIDKSTEWYRTLAPHIRAELVPPTRIQFVAPAGVRPSKNSKMQSILVVGPRRPWDPPAGVYPSFPLEVQQ